MQNILVLLAATVLIGTKRVFLRRGILADLSPVATALKR